MIPSSRTKRLVLAGMFVSLALFAAFQMVRLVYYRHNVMGFQSMFMMLCLVTAILRSVWCLEDPQSDDYMFLTSEFPLFLQLSTFSLLSLFFAFVRNKPQWGRLWWRYMLCWAIFNTTILILLVIVYTSIICDNEQKCFSSNLWNSLTALVYLVLAIFLAYYGVSLGLVLRANGHLVAPELLQRSPTQTLGISLMLVLIFLSRAAYDSVVTMGSWGLSIPAAAAGDLDWLCFGLLLLWDIVPTGLVLLFFRHIPSARARTSTLHSKHLARNHTDEDPSEFLHDTSPSQLFDNPGRYDSDEDDLNHQNTIRPPMRPINEATPLSFVDVPHRFPDGFSDLSPASVTISNRGYGSSMTPPTHSSHLLD